ncbi:MAG TPA: molybdenum cofactor guanylyltransferase [Arenimonas sp.]|nr:molybdenum cofactor guanylyltransferase [Arenimonas sp.]
MPSEQSESAVLGVVLAGGLSRRMGRDKALLDLHGRPLLRRQVEVLAALCGQVVVSGDYAGYDCVPDFGARRGPLGGIHSVCARFPAAGLLVLPVDMPQITSATLAALLTQPVSCHFDGQPLPAYFPDGGLLMNALRAIFDQPDGGLSVHRLHAALGSKALDAAGFEALNLNTPEQWAAYVQNDID